MKSAETVEISQDYLVSLHMLLNSSYEKISEILGESAANMFFALASGTDPLGLVTGDEDVSGRIGKISEKLAGFGFTLEEKPVGDSIEYRLTCPYADVVHPRLAKDATYCPMSQMVLGSVRKGHRKSVLTSSRLRKDGSAFTVRIQDE